MEYTVLGSPGDRRVTLFTAACRAAGLPEPHLVGWPDVLRGAPLRIPPGTLVRVDSPGESPEADALLRGPGDPARTGGGAAWHAAFTAALRRVGAAAGAAGARLTRDPDEIGVMFDKRRCHVRLAAAGVPVPAALPEVTGYDELRAAMDAAGERRVFVKPAHGSSGSGVVALQVAPGRIKAVTPTALTPDGPVNSLRLRTYTTEREVAALIDALAPDGLHVEHWLPKAALDGRPFDLRVVVVRGAPTHAVARTGSGPLTNLHLGGARGDLAAVRDLLGPAGFRRALDVCADAAACFPGSPVAGVDLLVGIGGRRLAVGEVNAFGDLLPNLAGLPEGPAAGLDVYTAQINADREALCRT
ncbi:STM4014 family protein [Actinomadura atramentaria]|uniref:STM4014 family protein n=1 Tax=Actinomadura atramentaria TaxID=1990 RepID=UPI000371F473|nr:STM4014 family protein [Actinomadura atramentaria]